MLFWLISAALADDMTLTDYKSYAEYDWSSLQLSDPYIFETPFDIIKFSIGENLEESCDGQYASAIRFSKSSDSCEILGKHELISYSIYPSSALPAIGVYYGGGEMCRDHIWGDIKKKIEFKLICSSDETDFYLVSSLKDCTVVFEKFTEAGCPQEIRTSAWVKATFFL